MIAQAILHICTAMTRTCRVPINQFSTLCFSFFTSLCKQYYELAPLPSLPLKGQKEKYQKRLFKAHKDKLI